MHSKTSNQQNSASLWKAESRCSEEGLVQIALDLAQELRPKDRVLLEGPMGVGKTTFARALLAGLGLNQPAEGSPTFAIAHEYDTPAGSVVHMDFYRLKSEMEIDDAGIPSYFWDRDLIVITEWLSSWPEFEALVMRSGRVFRVELEHPQNPEKIMSPENLRTIQIFQMNSSS